MALIVTSDERAVSSSPSRPTNKRDQSFCERAAPAEIIVAANELLVVNLVALREQHIAHVTTGLQNVPAGPDLIDLEHAGVHVKPDRQPRTLDKFLREPAGLRHCIRQLAHYVDVVGRPREIARLAEHV